jgi:hypothetical protein
MRLLQRVRKICSEHPYSTAFIGKRRFISLNEIDILPRELFPEEVRLISEEVKHIPQLIESDRSSRNSMVYSNENLETLVRTVLFSQKGLFEDDFSRILNFLLTPWSPTVLITNEENQMDQALENTYAIEIKESLNSLASFVDALDERDKTIMHRKLQGISDQNVGDYLGLTRQTVSRRFNDSIDRLRILIPDELPEQTNMEIMNALLELLSLGSN